VGGARRDGVLGVDCFEEQGCADDARRRRPSWNICWFLVAFEISGTSSGRWSQASRVVFGYYQTVKPTVDANIAKLKEKAKAATHSGGSGTPPAAN
jgi:hypothetical protein